MSNSNLRYVRGLTVPKTIGTGRKLMHNNVRHTVNMPTGVNGFRAWTDTKVPASAFDRTDLLAGIANRDSIAYT